MYKNEKKKTEFIILSIESYLCVKCSFSRLRGISSSVLNSLKLPRFVVKSERFLKMKTNKKTYHDYTET